MEWYFSLLFLWILFGILFLSGMPLAFAFFVTNVIGLYVFLGGHVAWSITVQGAHEILTVYSLLPVLFFILMGEILYHSGIVMSAIKAVHYLFGGVRGNLSFAAVAAGTIMAACSGSSMGTAAALGATLMPDTGSGTLHCISFCP